MNSLYGKFGQKEIESRIRVLPRTEAAKLVTNYHYSYLSEIGNGLGLIKYSARLNEKIRRLYKENEDELDQKFLAKQRGIISAVQISSRIAALARVSINKYKNMAAKNLYYTDTDSLILEQKLPSDIIGTDLGKWKLEADLIKGIFVRSKLYMYEDLTGNVQKVAAAVNAKELSYQIYLDLSKGLIVKTQILKRIVI
jgi:hypothetical protein